MICYYCLSFNQFDVQKSTVLHNVSNFAEYNVDGNGRLLLEALMGYGKPRLSVKGVSEGLWENMERQHLCFTELSRDKAFWMLFIAGF